MCFFDTISIIMKTIKLVFRLIFIILGALLGIKYPRKRYTYNRTYNVYRKDHDTFPKKQDDRLNGIVSENCQNQAERNLVSSLLDYGISPRAIFHNLCVRNSKNRFSQIDVVVATKVGLIVFEVKDYSGWIFGKGKENKWTQSLKCDYRYKRYSYKNEQCKKYRFYNPVLQNESHIKALQKQSKQFEKLPFYSVVIFDGDCELRDISFIPSGTFVAKPYRLNEVLDVIFENDDAKYTDKHEVMRILKMATNNGANIDIQNKHVENIRDMLGEDRVLD